MLNTVKQETFVRAKYSKHENLTPTKIHDLQYLGNLPILIITYSYILKK
jgi:hypothetical protein